MKALIFLRVVDVGAGAEIAELPVLIERDRFALGDVLEPAELVAFLADLPDQVDRFFAADFAAG